MKGERLFDLRKDEGLTQDELSELIHVNKHSISSYERDKSEPPDDIKIKIADHFGVSVDYLLGITENPVPNTENSHYIRLPPNFPDEARADLKEYIQYLIFKYHKR